MGTDYAKLARPCVLARLHSAAFKLGDGSKKMATVDEAAGKAFFYNRF